MALDPEVRRHIRSLQAQLKDAQDRIATLEKVTPFTSPATANLDMAEFNIENVVTLSGDEDGNLNIDAPGEITFINGGAKLLDVKSVIAASGSDFELGRSGEAMQLRGSSITIFNDVLQLDSNAVVLRVKNGTPTESDPDGSLAIDRSGTGALYQRRSGAWVSI